MFKKIRNTILILITMTALVGCSTGMIDAMNRAAGLGVISQETSTFDGATVIKVSPDWLINPDVSNSSPNKVKLGAQWSSSTPDQVVLILSYGSSTAGYSGATYIGLEGIKINIDGVISSYQAQSATSFDNSGYNTVSKSIYTTSRNYVELPYSILKAMVAATDTRLRIHTSDGYEDSQFSVERSSYGQGSAILSIRAFMAKVDAEIASQ